MIHRAPFTARISSIQFSFTVALICLSGQVAVAADFARDVLPILSEHCAQCHGADEKERKSGLRLDQREPALKGGESGSVAIVPGKPDEGELIRRVTSANPDELMPPPSHNKPLSPQQIATLKQWIQEGANYETHWAFIGPVKTSVPSDRPHPIDALISHGRRETNLPFSPPAPAATIARRLYLDLIGVPPSPQELADFEKQPYEASVEALLRSERFGEKWARHWLDVARYSDSNGYEKDLAREQWKWRDWVVDAFNKDMPYDQFVIEQIAGDLLPGCTQDQIIATGFLRNSMINEEGAIVPEQFRMVEMFDRLDCLGKAVIGLSTQCAQCHSHKFDPLSHDEYFGLFAFLNNAYEAQSWVYTPEQFQAIESIRQRIHAAEEKLRAGRPNWQSEFAAWQESVARQEAAFSWEPLIATELGSISGLNHPTQEADQSLLMKGHVSADVFFLSAPKLEAVTGLRLEALNHRDLPHQGPGRSRLGTWAIGEVEVFVKKPDAKDWEKLKLINASADFSQPEEKSADGKKVSGPVAHLIDGKDETTWNADRGLGRRNQPSVAVLQFEKPLTAP